MSMHVIACSHVDMAWKKNREEMKDLFESMIVRALDMMDQAPDFTFVVEQAADFRQLAETRPDLVDRVRRYVAYRSGPAVQASGGMQEQWRRSPSGLGDRSFSAIGRTTGGYPCLHRVASGGVSFAPETAGLHGQFCRNLRDSFRSSPSQTLYAGLQQERGMAGPTLRRCHPSSPRWTAQRVKWWLGSMRQEDPLAWRHSG